MNAALVPRAVVGDGQDRRVVRVPIGQLEGVVSLKDHAVRFTRIRFNSNAST